MKRVSILTRDERLARELVLLLPPELSVSPEAELLIVDADTVPLPKSAKERMLILSYNEANAQSDAAFLRRPFTFRAFREALAMAVSEGEALTPTEQRLFRILKEAGGAPVPRERLIREVWGDEGSDGLLNLYIHYLREKLEKDGRRRIFAARGKGYLYRC
jgi:DNA-binding response OmpR family regulator